jgi:hypothetical protein
MFRMRSFAAVAALGAACLSLAACAEFPELDAASRERITGDRALPTIAPIDGIRAEAATVAITAEGTAALQQRAAALQARGAGVQATAADPATVARLAERAACPTGDPGCVASLAATR